MSLEFFHRKKPLPLTPEGAALLSDWIRDKPDLFSITEQYYVGIEHFLLNQHHGWTPLHGAAHAGRLDQVARILEPSGKHLDPADFLRKDHNGWTVLHSATTGGHLDQVVDVLKATGQHLPGDYFLIPDRSNFTPLHFAAIENQLDQIFIPAHWIGRVGEMEKLWGQVLLTKRGRFDYASARDEAILLLLKKRGVPAIPFRKRTCPRRLTSGTNPAA